MGAGRGGDYGNIKNKVGRFVDNFLELVEEYQISKGGWFGTYSQSTVRHIISDDPMETMIDFMSRIILHAEIKPLENGHGYMAIFSDGFRITYRESSSTDGTPAVTIWTPNGKTGSDSTFEFEINGLTFRIRYQKIHFIPTK